MSRCQGLFKWLLWLIIFIVYAWIIAKRAPGKYFLHGFLVSLVNRAWVTVIVAGPIVGAAMGVVAGLFAFIASRFVNHQR